MSNDGNDTEIAAIGVAIAALAAALERSGTLSRQRYAAALRQAWLAMPDDQALGDGGAFIERLLGLLGEPIIGDVAPTHAPPLPTKGWYQDALRLLIPRAA